MSETIRTVLMRRETELSTGGSVLGHVQIVTPDGRIYLQHDIDFGATGAWEIFQNVKFILLTEYFSVPLDRLFGMEFRMVDKPIPVAEAVLVQEVAMKIAMYEWRCQFTEIKFSGDGLAGKLNPNVQITIVDTEEINTRYTFPTIRSRNYIYLHPYDDIETFMQKLGEL